MTRYLTLEDILKIHQHQLETYGGGDGVRDLGGLESALNRPQNGYYSDLIAEAAALWESLAQNHPFIDGNKRTAFAATYTFLGLNGIVINTGEEEPARFVLSLYDAKAFIFEKLEIWLRENTEALD